MKERQARFDERLALFYARCPECGAVIVFRPGESLAGACQHYAGRNGLTLFFEINPVRPDHEAGRVEG